MNAEIMCEQISSVALAPQLDAALRDSLLATGIVTEQDTHAVVGSRLYNVVTTAMDLLRKRPAAELIAGPVSIPNDSGNLETFAGHILNDSMRPREARPGINIISPSIKKLGTCAMAEEHFQNVFESVMDVNSEAEPSRLYIDKNGSPVLLEKQEGEASALAFADIAINGVRYPAGTLYTMEGSEGAPTASLGSFDVNLFSKDTVTAIGPLRLSSWAFEPAERSSVFLPVEFFSDEDSFGLNTDDRSNRLARQATLDSLQQYLPEPAQLTAAATQLAKS